MVMDICINYYYCHYSFIWVCNCYKFKIENKFKIEEK
uniref:Uncharacterized protein n=1 Tax=viral metagenome TaxID=1070528 RepID=A0A6C0LKX7_9ZZZZ